jgi:type 2 lantibiotic biosynthesis protein LanM
MLADAFRSSTWYRATTLAERLAPLRATPPRPDAPLELARARSILQRWRSQLPFNKGDYFGLRLAADPLSEDELLRLLAEPADAVAARTSTPEWLADLERGFTELADWAPAELPAEWQDAVNAGFLDLIAPLIKRGRERVRQGVRKLVEVYPEPPFDPANVEELFVASLLAQLRRLMSRTLVLELNVARLSGLLTGATPEDRYQSFLQRLRQRDTALALLQEYPVLARQLALCIERWANCSLEFLGHLCADWEAVRTLLPDTAPGPLVAIDANAGDTHRGGRAVLIAKFASGARVVYKPKPLTVDRHFQDLLAWLNEHGNHPGFRTFQIIERGQHGWVEFIEAGGCDSEEEVRRFYQRQGGYLALLYALEATDFHSENLIAAGEHPVLLDLEALFHPRTEGVDLKQGDDTRLAANALNYSVLRVNMLPRLIWSSGESAGVDISGLGNASGQLTPFGVPQLEALGTDAMHLVRKRIEMPPDQNRPTLRGAHVELVDYSDDIVTGFETIYRLLLEHREELLAAEGPLGKFTDDVVRVIIRQTNTYSVLLYESYHPDVLRDALDRDRLVDRLWVGIADNPYLVRLIPSERADILEGDIPLFTTRPGSHSLWTSGGTEVPDFFTESGMELVHERLRQLGPDDLARQRWIIRASLVTSAKQGAMPSIALREPSAPGTREALLAAALKVGERLDALAVRSNQGASWIGLDIVGDGHWGLVPLGIDLYAGLPGVALFLGYLGAVTGEKRYANLAHAATATLLQQIDLGLRADFSVGGFDGWGGVVYTLAHLGSLWERPDLLAVAGKIVGYLPAVIERDANLDITSGAAGCIGGLLALEQVAPSAATLAAAIRCGQHLLAHAQPMAHGIAWKPHVPARAPLTGFSHGAAGISWALLELSGRTGEERFRSAALDAINYERSLFSPSAGNWPDYRLADGVPMPAPDEKLPDDYFVSWCHGAPGIGLSRLQALRHLDDANLRPEIYVALRTTLGQGFGKNHTLCHGDLGNLELIARASRTLGDPHWQYETERLTAILLESIARDGLLCAAPRAIESPGLMTGLAGIGMGLLRLAEPERVPSVLTFGVPA